MQLIRQFESKSEEMYKMAGKIRGFFHVYNGQEAIAAGCMTATNHEDPFITGYRDHGLALAKGMSPNAAMAELYGKATGCSKSALAKIINKGAGAYYSSGSRPNQTAQSWGVARLASSITSGKAAAVDYNILEEGCKPKSKALTLAKRARAKHGHGTRRVPKVKI